MEQEYCNVRLTVQPSRALVDEKFSVCLVEGAPSGAPITLHSVHRCTKGHEWEAYAHYMADVDGRVNVCEDPSLGGTYSGVEPMGLIWSLRTVPPRGLMKTDVQTPMEVSMTVYLGHLTEGFEEGQQLASVLVERWFMAPGVKRIPITEQDLTATLFLPPGPGPFPGVLDLWGAGMLTWEHRSALLASHGFAAMVINYTAPDITQKTGVVVDKPYFETAYRFLQQHPKVNGSIGMVGLSLGAALIFKLAVNSDVMKPKCAVCMNGSHIQQSHWTFKDFVFNLFTNRQKGHLTEDNLQVWRNIQLPIPTDPQLKVEMGRLQCPLLLIAGEDDQNYPAYECVQDIKEMMQKAGNSHLLSVLTYPNTGHFIDTPYTGHVRHSPFGGVTSTKTRMVLWGGQAAEHCLAQEDIWRKTLAFLRRHLSNTKSKM